MSYVEINGKKYKKIKISDGSNSSEKKNKKYLFILILLLILLPIAFLFGYSRDNSSNIFNKEYLEFDLSISQEDNIYLELNNIRSNNEIILSYYSINNKSGNIIFELNNATEKKVLIESQYYQYFDLSMNNTNIFEVCLINQSNLIKSKTISVCFNFTVS